MSEPSIRGIPETFVSRVSAAIRPVDGLSPGGVPIGSLTVSLDGVQRPPIRNRGGWYVFPDLPDGTYTVRIQTELYREVSMQVDVAGPEPVTLDVSLQPACSYPFPGHATLLRGVVRTSAQQPAAGAVIEAAVLEPASVYTASLTEQTMTGDTLIKLSGLSAGTLEPGSVLLLKDSNTSKLEYVRLASSLPEPPASAGYPLAAPLRFAHLASTAVYTLKASDTFSIQTDWRGEFVIPVARLALSLGFVAVKVMREGYYAIQRDIQCEEGQATSLGVLTLLSI